MSGLILKLKFKRVRNSPSTTGESSDFSTDELFRNVAVFLNKTKSFSPLSLLSIHHSASLRKKKNLLSLCLRHRGTCSCLCTAANHRPACKSGHVRWNSCHHRATVIIQLRSDSSERRGNRPMKRFGVKHVQENLQKEMWLTVCYTCWKHFLFFINRSGNTRPEGERFKDVPCKLLTDTQSERVSSPPRCLAGTYQNSRMFAVWSERLKFKIQKAFQPVLKNRRSKRPRSERMWKSFNPHAGFG